MSLSDPSWHQQREQEMLRHLESLLADRRFVLDTTDGRRATTNYQKLIVRNERSSDVKRRMIELGSSDFSLQRRMPQLASLDVQMKQIKWWIFEKVVGEMKLVCVSPVDELIRGQTPGPMDESALRQLLRTIPPPAVKGRVPQTLIVMNTSGFTKEAALLADRLAERTVVLIEPGIEGGWKVHGSPEIKAMLDLLDPEPEGDKARRIRDLVHESQRELGQGGLSAERLAARLALPLDKVEREFKAIASLGQGLAAKRFDGRLVLYRESSVPASGAGKMAFVDKVKSWFGQGDSDERKLAILAERRTEISIKREREQEDLIELEKHEGNLREEFKKTDSELVRRRLTTQITQIRQDIGRKQEILQMYNQQMSVIGAYEHKMRVVREGKNIQLPDNEGIAEAAARADEVMAELEADAEIAKEVGGVTIAGMSQEEKSIYDELMAEVPKKETDKTTTGPAKQSDRTAPEPTRVEADRTKLPPIPERARPEPG